MNINPDDMGFLLAVNARLTAALQEIGELGDVDCDEAPELARRALKADGLTEHQEKANEPD